MEGRNCATDSFFILVSVLQYRTWSTKSDVWSYGIVMWELFTFGKIPYPSLQSKEVEEFVGKGERNTIPDSTPPLIAKLMRQCWREDPARRPTFAQIVEFLRSERAVKQKQ